MDIGYLTFSFLNFNFSFLGSNRTGNGIGTRQENDEALMRLINMFPNIPIEIIKSQVERAGSPSRAVEQLLVLSQQYPMNQSDNGNSNQHHQSATNSSLSSSNRRGLESRENDTISNQKKNSNHANQKLDTPTSKYFTNSSSNPPLTNEQSSNPAMITTDNGDFIGNVDKVNIEKWKDDPKFRESLLLNRKQQMLLKARQKFTG